MVTDLADVKNNQQKFKSYLGEIEKGNIKHKSKEQKNTLHDIEKLYKARNEAIKFYDDQSLMMSEAKVKGTYIKRNASKISNSSCGSNSLLNEIRQIVYSLYQSKQITKKVFNKIIESIQ